jgi:hypothetical protein
MKNFLKTLGIILMILGTYLFILNIINRGGYQIVIGAAIGGMGYIFFKSTIKRED